MRPLQAARGNQAASRFSWAPSFIDLRKAVGLLWLPLAILVASNGYAESRQSQPPRKLFPVRQNGRWGYIDKTGKLVIPAQFKEAHEFSDGLALVWPDRKLGPVYINETGAVVIDPYPPVPDEFHVQYDKLPEQQSYFDPLTRKWIAVGPSFVILDDFSDGLARVRVPGGEPCGYIDKTGKVVIKLPCEQASNFSEGRAQIRFSWLPGAAKFGYIDKAGAIVIKPQFDMAGTFLSGVAPVAVGKQWGLIDKAGVFVAEPQFLDLEGFSEGLASVADAQGLYGYINQTGKTMIKPRFAWAFAFSEGLAGVVLAHDPDHKLGYIDRTGEIVIKPQFDNFEGSNDTEEYLWRFSEGLAAVKVGDEWGYVGPTGKIVIKPLFEWAGKFCNGPAAVGLNGKMGYIDRTGKVVIEPRFNLLAETEDFCDGIAGVWSGDMFGYIDSTGKYVWGPSSYKEESPR